MTRITREDTNGLAQGMALIHILVDAESDPKRKNAMQTILQRCRKVWIMLNMAQAQGTFNLEELCSRGIDSDSDTAKAIQALCPNSN